MPIEGRDAHPQAVGKARAEGAREAVGAQIAALRRERSRAWGPGRRGRNALEHHEPREGVSAIASRLGSAEQIDRLEIKKLGGTAGPGQVDAVENQAYGGIQRFAELTPLSDAAHLEKARPPSAVGRVDVGAFGKKALKVTLAPGLQVGLGEDRDGRRQFLEGSGLEGAGNDNFL